MPPDVYEKRRLNLQSLIAASGTVEGFARSLNTDATYLRNIKNGARRMGSNKARQIEKHIGLPKGAMDTLNLGAGQQRSEISADSLLADLQRLYQIDRAHAEKAIRILNCFFEEKKPLKPKKNMADEISKA